MFHAAIARPNLLVKIPATDGGARGDRGDDSPRPLDQRDLDLLAHPPPAGDRGVPTRPRAPRRRRRRPGRRPLGRQLRLAGRHETDRRLDKLGREDLKGRLGIANARLAYQQYKHAFTGDRWERLAALGATSSAASGRRRRRRTPSYRDTLYVEELLGWKTISTMPEETIGLSRTTAGGTATGVDVDEALDLFAALAGAGVDYDDVVAELEHETSRTRRLASKIFASNFEAKRRSPTISPRPAARDRDLRGGSRDRTWRCDSREVNFFI